MEKLTDREVDIMMAIWHAALQPVPTGDILRSTPRAKRNSLQALQVVMRRLCEKGVIACEKGRQTNFYSPLISEDAYLKFAGENFLAHHYPHGLSKFAVDYILDHTGELSDAEVDALRKALKLKPKKRAGP